MTTTTPSAWDTALNPPDPTNDIYGEIQIDVWFCTLKKGVGKSPFIEGQDRLADRRTAVDVVITDIGGTNYSRSFIAEIVSDGWRAVTLPSLKPLADAAGIHDLQALNGRYVHAEMVAYGEYTDANGVKKTRTAPRILRLFNDRAEAEAAVQGMNPLPFDAAPAPAGAANGHGPVNGTATPNGNNDAERATAAAFLLPLARAARRGNGIDAPTLEASLKSAPLLARHFTMASPEVAQAMAQALDEPAF